MCFGLVAGIGVVAAGRAKAVEIEYWQYVFDTRIKAMDELIKRFQAANPGITVKHTHLPLRRLPDQGRRRDPGRPGAGRGAALLRLARQLRRRAKFVQPLPTDAFPPEMIEKEFFPIVAGDEARRASTTALPTAVRSLALFYNKKLFEEAGLDPAKPPQTLDEFVAAAQKTDQARRRRQHALGRHHHRTWAGRTTSGGARCWCASSAASPTATTTRRSTYDSEAGREGAAVLRRPAAEAQGRPGRLHGRGAGGVPRRPRGHDDRRHLPPRRLRRHQGLRVGRRRSCRPNAEGKRSNYASYWVNAITTKAQGEKLEAAKKFLAFVTSPEAMEIWLEDRRRAAGAAARWR